MDWSCVPDANIAIFTFHLQMWNIMMMIGMLLVRILKYNYLFWLITIVSFKIDLKSFPRSAFCKHIFSEARLLLKISVLLHAVVFMSSCLLEGPNLWKRMPLKYSITVVFTFSLLS